MSGTGSPEPITFDGQNGQFSLVTGAELDWNFIARLTANARPGQRFAWASERAGGGPAQGELTSNGDGTWSCQIVDIGPDGELVVDITALGLTGPDDAFEVIEREFWLFRWAPDASGQRQAA